MKNLISTTAGELKPGQKCWLNQITTSDKPYTCAGTDLFGNVYLQASDGRIFFVPPSREALRQPRLIEIL